MNIIRNIEKKLAKAHGMSYYKYMVSAASTDQNIFNNRGKRNSFMPNWCSNNIHLKANPQILDKVVKQILIKDGEEYKFNFQHFLPMPKELDIEDSSKIYIQQSWLDIKQQPQRKFIELEEEIKNKYHMPVNIFSEMKQYFSELFDWSNLTVGEIFIHFEENPEIASRFYYFHDLANRIAENIEKYGHATWYGWRLSNWGCTWEVCDDSTYVTVGTEDIWINCDTAWGPPEGIYNEIARRFPDVEFEAKYFEDGMWFAGTYKGFEGALFEYPCKEEEVRAFAAEHFSYEYDEDD